jgi:fructosamine-3-kinase
VELADGTRVFVKAHDDPPRGMFAAEADGLAWLAESPLRVPRVIAVDERWLALATLPQSNADASDWPTFYVERRLRPLCTHARLGVDRALDELLARRDRFGPPEPPARLHGDLWWGNVASCADGPVVFDPAAYGGHREVDLAMLALFGDLPDALVAAYDEVWPLADGWRDRIPLNQLYPLAAHACLFGGGYGARVARTLAELVG